jgi:Flp pilus assembly protein CpaB
VENLLRKNVLGTPGRTVVAGAAALILATILLLVYLSHYRNSVKSSNAAATVLIATNFIPKGMTADAIAKDNRFKVTPIPKEQLKDGAVIDAAVLHGQVALDDIYPGQQLTVADFGTSATVSRLSAAPELLGEGLKAGTWRALSLSFDTSRGIIPQVQNDDRVDVYQFVNGVMALYMPNVLVLAAPNQAATNTTAPISENYILRVPSSSVAKFAFLAESGKMWFALRPQTRAKPPTQQIPITSGNVDTAK